MNEKQKNLMNVLMDIIDDMGDMLHHLESNVLINDESNDVYNEEHVTEIYNLIEKGESYSKQAKKETEK